MSEPRCGVVHLKTLQLLAKEERGDCDAGMSDAVLEEGRLRPFKKSAYEFKLQVAKTDDIGDPELLWIRIGSHPQRCLSVSDTGMLRFENWMSPAAQEPLWRIIYVDAQEAPDISAPMPAMCFLQSVKTGQYLSAGAGLPTLQAQPDMWGFVQLRNASSPGRVARGSTIAVGAGVTVGAAATVGIASAVAVGAVAKTGRAVAATGAAVTGASHAVVAVGSGGGMMHALSAIAAVPGAIMTAITSGQLTIGVVGGAAAPIMYGVGAAGVGLAIGTGGTVLAGVATLMNCARDHSLYVIGYAFLPKALSRSISKLSTPSLEDLENQIPATNTPPRTFVRASAGQNFRKAMPLQAQA